MNATGSSLSPELIVSGPLTQAVNRVVNGELRACGPRWGAPQLVAEQVITQGKYMGPAAGLMGEGVTEISVPGFSFSSAIQKYGG